MLKVTQLVGVSKDQDPGHSLTDIIVFLLYARHMGCGPCSIEIYSLLRRQINEPRIREEHDTFYDTDICSLRTKEA